MLRDLFEQLDDQPGLPLIKGDRCVHALVENASCRACVEVCPHNAWQIDDASVSLDTSLCDGCGLCVPACSEGAISHEFRLEKYSCEEETVAFVVCEFAEVECDKGLIPCLHSFGFHDLLSIYRQGIHKIFVNSGVCDQCPRGRVKRLSNRISSLNCMLLQRGKKMFDYKFISPSVIPELIKHLSPPENKKLSRRNFFRAGTVGLVKIKKEVSGLSNTDHIPPGNLLPSEHSSDILLFSPSIDVEQCVGCDACFKVCPHKALQIVDDNNEMYYQIEDDNCTGCQLCTDVCEQNAVQVDRWRSRKQEKVLLFAMRCKACGVSFHVPSGNVPTNSLCHICIKHNHTANLYQVLE